MQFLLTVFHCKAMQAKMALIFISEEVYFSDNLASGQLYVISFDFFFPVETSMGKPKTDAIQGRAESEQHITPHL